MTTARGRRVLAASAVTLLALVAACSGGQGEDQSASQATQSPQQEAEADASPTPQGPELPMGGRKLFPEHRIVGYAGIEGTGPVLGKLGVGSLDDRMQEVAQVAQNYGEGVNKVLPVVEFIATVVHGDPGDDGLYRGRATDERVQQHLDAARSVNGILLLAIQPGRSDFVTETKYYEKFLKEPDVGVALDPEWRMGPGEIPMQTYGHVTGKELDDTAAYLQQIVQENNLPEKVMLYHQLRVDIVRDTEPMQPREGIAQMVSIDGIGDRDMKVSTYNAIMRHTPRHVYPGFKLFYMEDAEFEPIMTPEQVIGLTPSPWYVLYE